MRRFNPASTFAYLGAAVVGVMLGCPTESLENPDHCYHAFGDQTCAHRFGEERPYCASPTNECGGDLQYGCVAELPPEACYSPCGGGALASEDGSCLETAAETETDDETETGDAGDGHAPSCGDGVLDADEECDDGNAVDDDACSNACIAASCGDGLVQPLLGETCDDGNTLSGDTCSSTCLLPGTVLWSRTYDFEPCRGHGVVITSTGNLAVSAQCQDSGWRLLGFDEAGELLWNRAGVEFGSRVASGPSGELALGGTINGSQGQVRSYDSEGTLSWSKNVPLVSSFIRAVAIDAEGGILAAGGAAGDRILHRYSSGGELEWAVQEPGGEQFVAVAANAAGSVWALRLDPFRLEVYSSAGDLDWSSGLLGSSTFYGELALDAMDNVYVVGQTNTQWTSFYVAKYAPDGMPLWTELHDEPGVFELGHSVAVLPNGGALVAGYTKDDGVNAESDGLLSWFAPDGPLLQDVTFDGEYNNDNDVFHDLAVTSEGYAVAVGYQENTLTGYSLWLVEVAI